MVITKEQLLKQGWSQQEDSILHTEEFMKVFFSENDKDKKFGFYATINNYSNMVNRDWSLHLDNNSFETVGSCDIQTFEHIKMFLNIFNIKI